MSQSVPPSIDPLSQCLSALDALYSSNPDPALQRAADTWLIAFEKDRTVWMVADQILHRQGLPEHAYFYAVNTLLAKLQFFFTELSEPTHRSSFRDSLLSHALRFASTGSPTVRSKLAQAVACLTVHMLGLGEWPGAIGTLVATFGKDVTTALMLLDILTYLPEENHNPKLFIHSSVRIRAQREMTRETEQIVQLLMQYLASSSQTTQPNGQTTDYVASGILLTPNAGPGAVLLPHVSGQQKAMHTKILATFLAWVKASGEDRQYGGAPLGSPTPADALSPMSPASNVILSSDNLIQHPLLLFCFKIVASRCDELEQIAIDVLCSLMQNFNLVSRSIRGGFRGFRTARQFQDEEDGVDGDGGDDYDYEDGEYDGGQYRAGSFAPHNQSNQYQHIYFMRFMVTRIFELVPLFESLPPPATDAEPDGEDDYTSLARWYGRLFGDLAEYYLDFMMEFCLGVEGISELHDPEGVRNLRAIVAKHVEIECAKSASQPQPPSAALIQSKLEELVQSNQKYVGQIVEIILKCAAHPRREVNSNVMYFFFLLSEALNAPIDYRTSAKSRHATHQQLQTNGASLTPLQIRAKKKQAFMPAFQSMIPILHRLLILPRQWTPPNEPHHSGTLSLESREEVTRIREHAGQVLGDVERIVGHESILDVIVGDQVMGRQVQAYIADRSQWRELEASLYCILKLGSSIFRTGDDDYHHVSASTVFQQGGKTHTQLLPKVFEFLLDPNSPVLQCQPLKYTTLKVLERYATWVKEYVKVNPQPNGVDYLTRVLSCITTGLQDGAVCKPAARALRVICEENRQRLANSQQPNYIEGLMKVYNTCCTIPVVGSGKNAAGFTLEDQLAIIQGVAAVVSCVQSTPPSAATAGAPLQPSPTQNALPHYLSQLTYPMVSEMQKILTQLQQIQSASGTGVGVGQIQLPSDVSQALTGHLERLAETIAFLSPTMNPHKEFFIACLLEHYQKTLSPILYTLMQHLCSDERRMDKVCRVIKHVIKMTKLEFLTACLEPLIHQLYAAFNQHAHACFIYLLGKCVEAFGVHPNFHPILQQMLPAFITGGLRAIPDLSTMIQNPDMTEDFFDACTRVLDVCPDILFGLQTLPQIIERSIIGLSLHHKDSLSSVCYFIAGFLMMGVDTADALKKRFRQTAKETHIAVIRQCLQTYGQPLCESGKRPATSGKIIVAIMPSFRSFGSSLLLLCCSFSSLFLIVECSYWWCCRRYS